MLQRKKYNDVKLTLLSGSMVSSSLVIVVWGVGAPFDRQRNLARPPGGTVMFLGAVMISGAIWGRARISTLSLSNLWNLTPLQGLKCADKGNYQSEHLTM